MKHKKFFLIALLMTLVLSACVTDLANGDNYHCTDESYLDIVQVKPDLQVRFTCTDKNQGFEITFTGPDDKDLIEKLRKKNEVVRGLGVILRNGQIVQLYESWKFFEVSHWRAKE